MSGIQYTEKEQADIAFKMLQKIKYNLEQQLKEAEKVIDFYASMRSYTGRLIEKSDTDFIGTQGQTRLYIGGKRAREYKTSQKG